MNFENLFYNTLSKKSSKWSNYFEIYHKHFDKFLNKEITLLEIGIAKGGSLELWHNYFGNKCKIFAIDIDPKVLELAYEFDTNITIGNQSDNSFWKNYLSQKPNFDIVIDDGGHSMIEQITTLINIFPHLNDGGVLLIEDTHTSYWRDFGGQLLNPDTLIERSKTLIDFLHKQHIPNLAPNKLLVDIFNDLFSITFYNSIVVFEKRQHKITTPVNNY